MSTEIREIEHYSKWFRALRDSRARARILVRITRLSQGNPGDVKSVGCSVSELSLSYGPGYRIYYLQRGDKLVILLAGGNKSSQRADIAKATELAEYL